MDTPDTPASVPAPILRELRRAIEAAERPAGMSTHDGRASVDASHLRWVLDALERLQREAGAASEVLADAAALRLLADHGMSVSHGDDISVCAERGPWVHEPLGDDKRAALVRAITRAAQAAQEGA